MRLEGKVIVITGAAAGIGRAMAKRFAAEGAKVVGGDVAAGTASKHGLVGLTRNTAFVYAPQGIRCNAALAGGVATEIGSTIDPAKIDQEAMARFGMWHAAMPAQLEADDIADLVLFLVSEEASRINGALVPADAGWLAA